MAWYVASFAGGMIFAATLMVLFTERDFEAMRYALIAIADEQKVYLGHGDYEIVPAYDGYAAQTLARDVLTKHKLRKRR